MGAAGTNRGLSLGSIGSCVLPSPPDGRGRRGHLHTSSVVSHGPAPPEVLLLTRPPAQRALGARPASQVGCSVHLAAGQELSRWEGSRPSEERSRTACWEQRGRAPRRGAPLGAESRQSRRPSPAHGSHEPPASSGVSPGARPPLQLGAEVCVQGQETATSYEAFSNFAEAPADGGGVWGWG